MCAGFRAVSWPRSALKTGGTRTRWDNFGGNGTRIPEQAIGPSFPNAYLCGVCFAPKAWHCHFHSYFLVDTSPWMCDPSLCHVPTCLLPPPPMFAATKSQEGIAVCCPPALGVQLRKLSSFPAGLLPHDPKTEDFPWTRRKKRALALGTVVVPLS